MQLTRYVWPRRLCAAVVHISVGETANAHSPDEDALASGSGYCTRQSCNGTKRCRTPLREATAHYHLRQETETSANIV